MTTYSNVRCVGMHFRGSSAKEIALALEPGDAVTLELEPDNQHDANAIKVLVEDTHIGYVERDSAAWIAPDLEAADGDYSAIITGQIEVGRNTYPEMEISVGE